MTEYELRFVCCGNTVPIGRDRATGAHGDYCLTCETENPKVEIQER